MAKNREIEIDGDIGGWSYNMNYVRYMMNELGDGPVTVKVTSYGGDVNHALKIKNLFEEHGNVTVEYIGFNASAATVIGHGAKKTRIHEDAFYLIHKPAVWVDAWGHMNEDELSDAIAELRAQKKDAETVTLVLAQDYVNSRGMELKKVMELMQTPRWLPGKEAVELKLVDELIPSNKKAVITNQMRSVMSAAGFPVPEAEKEPETEPIGKIIKDELTKFFNFNTQTKMDKQYLCLNQTLQVEGLEVKDDKVTLAVAQILALNKALQEKETAVADAETAKTTAETALADVLNRLDAIDPKVKAAADPAAKVTAVQTKLAERPGTKPEAPQGASGKTDVPKDGADWDTINNLPHNKAVDAEII